jgi:hypothetical protein
MNRRELLRAMSILPLVSIAGTARSEGKSGKHSKLSTQAHVHGTCDKKFTAVCEVLAASLASGEDLGALR